MRPRTIAAAGTTWAVAVVGVAAVTWGVIDVAGRRVLGDSAVPTVASSPGASSPTVHRHRHRHHQATATPSPGRGPKPTPLTAGPTTAPPTGSPSETSSTQGSKGTRTPRPHPGQFTSESAHPSTAPSPTTTSPPLGVATWNGDAGTVTVSCLHGEVRLQGATPADGYRVEVEEEDDAIVVQFQREHPEDEVHLRATCVNGQPQFVLDAHRSSGPHVSGQDD